MHTGVDEQTDANGLRISMTSRGHLDSRLKHKGNSSDWSQCTISNSSSLGRHPQPKPSYQIFTNSQDSVCVCVYKCTYMHVRTHTLSHAKTVVMIASSYKTFSTHQTL